ncbi:MAG: response regulator [Myxococcales bacterium]|nr:response regulator [Myxococcales bacterium]MCB9718148.1 response regulator [Myxococcales bacterium]
MQVLLMTIDMELAEGLAHECLPEGIECSMEVEEPDAILVDDALPDATACVTRLYADDPGRPILLLVDETRLGSYPPEGVTEIIIKPPRPHELAIRLRSALRRRRQVANPREALALTAVEAAGDIVEITSPESVFEHVNAAFVQTLGYTYEEVVGRTPSEVMRSDQHDEDYFARIDEVLRRGETWKGLLISRAKNGRLIYLDSAISPVFDREGRITHHVAVKRDITQRLRAENELRRVNEELAQARDAALEASRAKSQFLANMSHELRTPLNAIIGYAEMLAEDAEDAEDEAAVADLGKIQTAGRHLLSLINDVLDLSKIEAGAMKLFIEAFELRTAIAGVVATITPLVHERDNELVVDVPDDLGVMRADLTKVRQALLNLLGNACKFTENGFITLAVRATEVDDRPFIVFAVRDTGIGMSEEQLARLFRPFVQADDSTTRRYGGTGLGLVISQRFCEMMGGHIEVDSEEGMGSTFRLLLPRVVEDVSKPTGEIPIAAQAPVPVVPRRGEDRGNPRILVIDDDPVVQDIVERSLTRHGFDVESARDGSSGLRRAREQPPDAIVLDVMMPGLDGWGVLTALKSDPVTAEIPVVMLTIIEQSDVGFALGAVDFLIKPVKTQRLASLLHRHCRGERVKVLIIDDDPVTREVTRRTLEADGHEVREAADGHKGIAALREQAPDLVLLDLMMPVMDGFAVLEHMRGNAGLREIPVIVVTAKELDELDREMLRGAKAVLERGALERQDLAALVTRRVAEALDYR